jgi:hypothetical protein
MLTYGSEAWTVCKRDEIIITAAEMKFMRTAGNTCSDYKRNLDTLKELKIWNLQKITDLTGKKHVLRTPQSGTRFEKDEDLLGRPYKRWNETEIRHWA